MMQAVPTMRARRRIPAWCLAGAILVAAVAAITAWLGSGGFVERVESEVRAGVPLGSSRQDAESWAERTYGVIPMFNGDVSGDRWVGRTVPELAGVPADQLGGVVRTTAFRRSPVGKAINLIDNERVSVYFLLDRQQRVCGYFFLSLSQLREMEIAKAR